MRTVCYLLPLLFILASAGNWCPYNWTYFGNKCIFLYPVWATWDSAKTLCSLSDSHLISLRSHDDVEFVSKMVVKLGAPVWTGGHSVDQSASWLWSDGSDFTFRFSTNHTSGKNKSDVRCLGIESEDGEAKSSPCGEMRFYICSRKMSEQHNDTAVAHSVDWFSGSALIPGVSLVAVMWAHSESVAEDILHSSSFLRQLQSGSITTNCYDLFRQQEALYMGLLYKMLEALYIQDTDPDVRTLLLHEKQRYKKNYSKQV
uniref:C-type lectin domain-containing protein n=1 Tax=Knipowitschia caucasica TaxID=637954 RepID=A0AAV2KQ05_KNICA